MQHLKLAVFVLGVLLVETVLAQTNCEAVSTGRLADTAKYIRRGKSHSKCWSIHVPNGSFARLNVTKLTLNRMKDVSAYLKINEEVLRPQIAGSNNPVTNQTKDVMIEHFVENKNNLYPVTSDFELTYSIGSTNEVGQTDSPNEVDQNSTPNEVGQAGSSIEEEFAISWLKDQRQISGGWREDTHRAIIALHLATGSNRGRNAEEASWFKEIETALVRELIRDNNPENIRPEADLALYTIALLGSCIDPEEFFQRNILAALKAKRGDVRPETVGYLAMCNAGENIMDYERDKLNDAFNHEEDKERLAYAIMTYSCEKERRRRNNERLSSDDEKRVNGAVRKIARLQKRDGKFTNSDTTVDVRISALLSQAIISWGKINAKDWSFSKAAQYLKKQITSDELEFKDASLALPVLAGKSMADVSCAGDLEIIYSERDRKERLLKEIEQENWRRIV